MKWLNIYVTWLNIYMKWLNPFAFSYLNCCCDKRLYLRWCERRRKLSEGYKREFCVFASEFFLFISTFFSDCAFLKSLLSCSLKIGATRLLSAICYFCPYLQVYVPQNIRKIYFTHKICRTRF